MCNACFSHLNPFKPSNCSVDWILHLNTLRLISALLKQPTHLILPELRNIQTPVPMFLTCTTTLTLLLFRQLDIWPVIGCCANAIDVAYWLMLVNRGHFVRYTATKGGLLPRSRNLPAPFNFLPIRTSLGFGPVRFRFGSSHLGGGGEWRSQNVHTARSHNRWILGTCMILTRKGHWPSSQQHILDQTI